MYKLLDEEVGAERQIVLLQFDNNFSNCCFEFCVAKTVYKHLQSLLGNVQLHKQDSIASFQAFECLQYLMFSLTNVQISFYSRHKLIENIS